MIYEKEFNSIRNTIYPDWTNEPLCFGGDSEVELISEYTPMMMRSIAIMHDVAETIRQSAENIDSAKKLITGWIKEKSIVRILGAGRALLAASLGANRLAHAGACVSFMGGMVPMPNSAFGGGIIAASASGQTKHVIEAMKIAKEHNPDIQILGIAKNSSKAEEFIELCDCFIGLRTKTFPLKNPLFALADEEEMTIAELLDGLIVQAGRDLGFTEEDWRLGHEDIGPTGPYSVRNK